MFTRVICIILMTLHVIACTALPHQRQSAVTMIFGLQKPAGQLVSEQEWQSFVESTLLAHFPQGFTVLSGQGYWQQSNGKILQEPTKIVYLVMPDTEKNTHKLDAIANVYKHSFSQEAVMEIMHNVVMEFH